MKALVALTMLLAGCAARSPHDRAHVSREIERRTGHSVGPAAAPAGAPLPEGVSLADGLTEQEAVALALWNNAAFQADLAALGVARADLVEAGLLRNPILSLLFPLGAKQLEASLTWPLEPLWQRPQRVAIAKLDVERVAENLVQNGLNLARDAKVAYAEMILAQERARLAGEGVHLRRQIAELAEARLRAGDVSELEATAARTEARLAEEQATRFTHRAAVANARLRALLGLGLQETAVEITPSPVPATAEPGALAELLKDAFAARPDLRAAELAIEAAGKRAGLERSKTVAIAGILDINEEGREGAEAGPGVQLELPFFNANTAGRARARAELERTTRHYVAVRHRIALEVREAHQRFLEARDAFAVWRGQILPPLEEAVRGAEKAYAAGEVSYLFVLETTRLLLDARLREAEATADLRRAGAQVERSVGKRTGGMR